MKTALLIILASSMHLFGQGICFHANSPEAPDSQIQFFEFDRFERNSEGYRFFMRPTGSVVVTNYRYRGAVIYNDNLKPGHPDFEKQMEFYENAVKKVPGSNRFLGPRIQKMRDQMAALKVDREVASALPRITIGEETLTSPVYQRLENGGMVISHQSGLARIPLQSITDDQYAALCTLQPGAAGIRIVELHGSRLWNPVMREINEGVIKIAHENGLLELDHGDLTHDDIQLINSWSDGSWKFARKGFYQPDTSGISYREIVIGDGSLFSNASLVSLNKEEVVIKHSNGDARVAIPILLGLKGMTSADSEKIEKWISEIIEERFRKAIPTESINRLDFMESNDKTLRDVRVRVLQVLADGILTNQAFASQKMGIATEEIIKRTEIAHPITGAKIIREIDRKIVRNEYSNEVNTGLCFIEINSNNLVDRGIVNITSMRIVGRYQYLDTRGVQRTVPKYKVD